MIRLVIFDYGRTLYDRDTDGLFEDAAETVKALASYYRLAIVSVSHPEEEQERLGILESHRIRHLFETIRFVPNGEDKTAGFEKLLADLKIAPTDVAVVDDYAIRGIDWGNRSGATTFWFPNGKFADVTPAQPATHTISSLSEIPSLLSQMSSER